MATITEPEDPVDTDTEPRIPWILTQNYMFSLTKIDESVKLPYGSDSIFNNLWIYILLMYVFECLLFHS